MNQQMLMAVSELYNDYSSNNELTAFTELDLENFHETKRNMVDRFRFYKSR